MDDFTPEKRSSVMASIRSNGNRTTELRLIEVFREIGIAGWRRAYPLFGRPDFAFPKRKVVVFVDSCFWHGCKRCFRLPTSNTNYWTKKIERNQMRDRQVTRQLRKKGWTALRLSESLFKNKTALRSSLRRTLS